MKKDRNFTERKEHSPLSLTELFIFYCKERRKFFYLLILVIVTMYGLGILYQIKEIRQLSYGILLSAFFCLLWGCIDFYKYVKEYKNLYECRLWIGETLKKPWAKGLKDKMYEEILETLWERQRELIFQKKWEEKEREDYYTLWGHQIKTPIAAIHLLLQREEIQNGMELREQVFLVEQYVDMVLQYLRLNSMSSDLLFKKYDIYEIVKKGVKKLKIFFIQKKLTLRLQEFSYNMVTDEKWLLWVLEQVILNAVKYTERGRIEIYMEDGILKISDTGIGVRPEDLPRIFERGFTGYNGREYKKSTGIGLYLCGKILDRLMIPYKVESALGKGTCFFMDCSTEKKEESLQKCKK